MPFAMLDTEYVGVPLNGCTAPATPESVFWNSRGSSKSHPSVRLLLFAFLTVDLMEPRMNANERESSLCLFAFIGVHSRFSMITPNLDC